MVRLREGYGVKGLTGIDRANRVIVLQFNQQTAYFTNQGLRFLDYSS